MIPVKWTPLGMAAETIGGRWGTSIRGYLFSVGVFRREVIGPGDEGVNHAEVDRHVSDALGADRTGVVVVAVLSEAVGVHEMAAGQFLHASRKTISPSQSNESAWNGRRVVPACQQRGNESILQKLAQKPAVQQPPSLTSSRSIVAAMAKTTAFDNDR